MKISEALKAYNERVDDYLTLKYTSYANAVNNL